MLSLPPFQHHGRARRGTNCAVTDRDAGDPRVHISPVRRVSNLILFALAAVFEIAGCFAFWLWLRRGVLPFVGVLGVVRLMAFRVVLTRVDSAFAGRAYAAYGGIYLTTSLVWL